jgi:catecholate siderophore receptor
MDSTQKDMGAGNAANGMPYANTPKHSISLWGSYQPGAQWNAGLGVYAQSSVNQGYILSTTDGGIVTKAAPGYARLDAMMAYQVTRNVSLQVNAYNLTGKVYYSNVRNQHYAGIAAGRSLAATLKFNY